MLASKPRRPGTHRAVKSSAILSFPQLVAHVGVGQQSNNQAERLTTRPCPGSRAKQRNAAIGRKEQLNTSKDYKSSDPLTVRERITLAVMLAIIKLMKPSDWSHQVSEMTRQIEVEMGFKSND